MLKRHVHLICNAHIDPVWLWERDEGIAAALSTFRCAAEFCEEFNGFIFNHNEAILYEWVEEYEPALFKRIQTLVAAGKWHIMGGWYLQPDCNMPSGESFVRQIVAGRKYFLDKFGSRPTTAFNVDPFGHDRGLVQIMSRSGYDSYIICRPLPSDLALESTDIRWIGKDGSELIVHRSTEWYNSSLGKAREKVEKVLFERIDNPLLILWGVGNHGGGASRADLRALAALSEELSSGDTEVIHSTPEDYFSELRSLASDVPAYEGDLRPWGVGCYTTMARIKRANREVEDALYSTEKAVTAAVMNQTMRWPREEFADASRDLMFLQFHDILPGSAIPEVEEWSLGLASRAKETLNRIRARAFFALAVGQAVATEGEIPIIVLNPHPWSVETVIECEFQLADQNLGNDVHIGQVYSSGTIGSNIPTQMEQERSNINLDWRKRIVFRARLNPNGLTRFDCRLSRVSQPMPPKPNIQDGCMVLVVEGGTIGISMRTGLVDRWEREESQDILHGAFAVAAYRDDPDPWGMQAREYTDELGRFILASPQEAARIAGVSLAELEPVRLIEDGPVRSVVEAIFIFGCATLVRRYVVYRHRFGIEIQDEVLWDEADRMLKLLVPTSLGMRAQYLGQGAFTRSDLPADGSESVAKRWVAALDGTQAVLVFTDQTYGSDYREGTIRLNMLRTAAYAAHPIPDRPLIRQDRALPRIDRGVRNFSFWIESGPAGILDSADKRGLERGEKPYAISFFSADAVAAPTLPGCVLESDQGELTLSSLKRAEADDGWTVRIYDSTGHGGEAKLMFPALNLGPFPVGCGPWEVGTWKLLDQGILIKTNLIEEYSID